MKISIPYFALLLGSLFLTSCESKKDKSLADSLAADSLKASQKIEIPDFKKSFEGSINNKYQITMSLTKTGKVLSGSYAYASMGNSFNLSGTIEDDGTIVLNEYSATNVLQGIFNGTYRPEGISGTWKKPTSDKLMPFLLTEKAPTISDASASCMETEFENEEGHGTKKTCLFNDFKTVSTGYANDRNGKMYWIYEIFQNKNGKYVKIQNSALFNVEQKELLKLINERIKRDFTVYSTEAETRDCFSDFGSLPVYKMNDLGIDFNNDEITFHIEFNLPEACDAVGGTSVTFKIADIIKYLN
ncbi:hypothetical protein SKC37_01720 [Aquirufa sp. HETE-83D]|uniref:DUF3298 domain-containing protein n=1 Tax=Aquirufa esocilacus TaxID=3096513 RepID=A0ABW6DF82_9BACT